MSRLAPRVRASKPFTEYELREVIETAQPIEDRPD